MEKHDYMDCEVAKYLIAEFERQSESLKLDEAKRNSLIEVLETTPVLESEQFCEEPTNNQKYTKRQIFNGDPDRTGYLRLTRIIRNKNAGSLTEGLLKKLHENIVNQLRFYSSTVELRHMRKEKQIVEIMLKKAETNNKFKQLSVLFRYQQVDLEGVYENTKVVQIDRPIIVIPDATKAELEIVRAYEEREGQVHITTGEGRYERVKIVSYADYLNSIRNPNS